MTNSIRTAQRMLSLVVLGAVAASLSGCGSEPIPAPTAYAPFELKDGGWACDYPEGWSADGGGKKNSWATFAKGSAKIKLQTDVSGSVLGDMASLGQRQGPMEMDDYPVHKVHMSDPEAGQAFGNYQEQEPLEFTNQVGGYGRKSEFTASGGLSGPIKGYRATFLTRDKRFRVTCTCNESDWANLKPAFDKVLESFRPANTR